jgi:uncharacterized protein (TIGR03435 family)
MKSLNERRWTAGFAALAGSLALVMASLGTAFAQAQNQGSAADAPKYEYEVASIKPTKQGNLNGPMRMGLMYTQSGLNATGIDLRTLIQSAYGVQRYQVIGGPDWLDSDRYEIDAKMDDSVAAAVQKLSQDDRKLARQQMLQALLADRLKLTTHKETKELPVYELVVAKNGSKLKEAEPGEMPSDAPKGPDGRPAGPGTMQMSFGPSGMSVTGHAAPIANLVSTLSANLGRPVVDKTGLAGNYDFTLQWMPDQMQMKMDAAAAGPGMGPGPAGPSASSDSGAPTLRTALQEQLGLKLEAGKGPVEIIVIDHVERPSDN